MLPSFITSVNGEPCTFSHRLTKGNRDRTKEALVGETTWEKCLSDALNRTSDLLDPGGHLLSAAYHCASLLPHELLLFQVTRAFSTAARLIPDRAGAFRKIGEILNAIWH